jgi:hypothetical protein
MLLIARIILRRPIIFLAILFGIFLMYVGVMDILADRF